MHCESAIAIIALLASECFFCASLVNPRYCCIFAIYQLSSEHAKDNNNIHDVDSPAGLRPT